jgi:hypothetical protein
MLGVLGRTAGRIGLGLTAGAIGTAAMTAIQMLEMKFSDREPSTMPADAVDELVDVAPQDEEKRQNFSNLVHWGYGTSLGALRGMIAGLPITTAQANVLFFGTIWGAPMVYLPALDLADPPTEWEPKQIAIDFAHHVVYAATVAAAWNLLSRERPIR